MFRPVRWRWSSRWGDDVIAVVNLTVEYKIGQGRITPIRDLTHTFGPGSVGLMGPSGSGKSTLLRVLAGTQSPTTGRVSSENGSTVSLIYQDSRLVEFLTASENLSLAAELNGAPLSTKGIGDLLRIVGLAGSEDRMPSTMSGGEQQRVAIARAMATEPDVLLADEPTGALDPKNSHMVARLLADLAHDHGITVIVASHDPKVANEMDVQLRIEEQGCLVPGVL